MKAARTYWTAAAVLGLVLTGPPVALAHDISFSYADVRWSPARVEVQLSVHRDDAAGMLSVADPRSLMEPTYLASRANQLSRGILAGFHIRGDGSDLALRLCAVAAKPERHAVALTYLAQPSRPVHHLEIAARLFPGNTQHQTFLNVYAGGRLQRQEVLTAARSTVVIYAGGIAGIVAVLATFVRAGIHHIFIGPDHIL